MVFRKQNRNVRRGRRNGSRRQNISADVRLLTFDTTVYHGREEIGPFPAGNAGFTVSSNVINLSVTSQLSGFASLFSEYRFTRMEFIYVPIAATSTLGTVFVSYSSDIGTGAPGSLTAVSSRGLSFQIPGTNSFSTMPSVRRNISNLQNVLTIPRSYNNLAWYRTRTSLGVSDMNSVGIIHYGTNLVQTGVIPGLLYIDYTLVLRSHI
jgi:hypothetical protein